jgi:Domain of unknown function (DUF4386)
MSTQSRRVAAALLVLAVVLSNVAFLGLGSIFEYPDILQQSSAEILDKFRADEAAIIALFVTLAAAAALLAPIAILLGRLAGNDLGRWVIRVGIAAAAVQVIGLLRWALIVPFLADRKDTDAFETVHTLLGTVVGETFGYLLTATWTILVIAALGRRLAGRWFSILGYVAAGLIAIGVFVPLDLPGADLANFLGYILWSVWLLAFAFLIWRRPVPVGEPGTRQASVPKAY